MSLVLKDRVLETAAAPGTGAVTLLGAVTGYQTFSAAIGNGNTCYYTIADQSGANWEVGLGTYSSSGNTLARTTILSSSNAGSTVNFASGTQNVFVTYPSEKAVYLDASGNVQPSLGSATFSSITDSGLTSGRVTYAGTGGLLQDSANLTFNGTTLTANTLNLTNALGVASGGTGLTSLTSGYIPYGNGTSAFSSSGALQFSGSNLTVNGTYAINQSNLIEINNGQSGATKFATGLSLTSDSGGNYTSGFYIVSGSNTPYNLMTGSPTTVSWYSANSEKMRLTSTGLGIGTSSPSYTLDVAGTTRIGTGTGLSNTILNGGNGAGQGSQITLQKAGTATGYIGHYSAIQGSGTSNDIDIYSSAGIQFGTNNTQVATLDSSGNLGLGVTPSAWGTYKAYQVGNASLWGPSTGAYVSANLYYNGANRIYISNGYATEYEQNTGTHLWNVAPSGASGGTVSLTQAMTLDNNGYLSIGTTSAFGNAYLNILYSSTSQYGTIYKNSSTTFNGAFIDFRNSAGSSAGNIIQNGTTTVSFTTSSDYRLKENIAPMTGALAKIQALKPVTYKWKQDGSDGQGFIAHELQEVVPDCVVGEKDAVDDEGNPKYQGIDTSFLVATLVSAIQEQQAIIEQLKTKIL